MANFSKNRHISDVELNQGVCSFFHRSLFLTKRNSIFEKIDKIIFEVKSFQWDDYYFVLINVLLEVACRFCRMSYYVVVLVWYQFPDFVSNETFM